MVFNNFRSVRYYSIFLMLTVFVGKGNSVTLDGLKVVFMYEFPFDFDLNHLPPDDICTSVGVFNDHPPPQKNYAETIEVIKKNRCTQKQLPVVIIYVTDLYIVSPLDGTLVVAKTSYFLEKIIEFKENYKVDVVIFDFLETNPTVGTLIHEPLIKDLETFMNEVKKKYPDLLLGLVIYNNSVQNKAFRVDILDKCLDLFLVDSYNYKACGYEDEQDMMASPPTAEELERTVSDLVSNGFSIDKLFLTIELVAKSWKNDDEEHPERWPYSHMCEATPGKKRRYCTQSLQNLYQQASKVAELKVKGVFIRSADLDDWNNLCTCGKFPALKAIKDGLTLAKEDPAITGCKNFGLLKKMHT